MKRAGAHDEFGARLLVQVKVKRDLEFDHCLLATQNLRHVGSHRIDDGTEAGRIASEMRDPRSPYFVLEGKHATAEQEPPTH